MRMFHYPQLGLADPVAPVNKRVADFRFPSVEEALQHAHRSQPSAD